MIPDSLVEQFRAVALERLNQIEASWDLVVKNLDDRASATIHRELHTLKGEARMVGFAEVNAVCHKLEDLLSVARSIGYAVDEDFDLAVNMALRFMAMLVRKRSGTNLGGFDLPGFIRHIDNLLQDWRGNNSRRSRSGSMPAVKAPADVRISQAARTRLAESAVNTFVEYAAARGSRRNRLRGAWHTLRDLVGIHRAVVGPDQLVKHRASAEALALELGKSVSVELELVSIEVTAEVLAAIDNAVLHLLRNAIDHGIEHPGERIAAGKPAMGAIRIGARRLDDDRIEVIVADDGRGIDFGRVRMRAVERGLVDDAAAETLDRDAWIDLLCTPGFSTRDQATEISGRGVGLDSVRATALELGGELTARSTDGGGTTWRIALPLPHRIDDGHVLSVPGLPFPIVIEGTWHATRAPIDAIVIDIACALGMEDASSGSAHAFTRADSPAIAVLGELRGIAPIRRLVASPPNAFGEVVMIDVAEGLLIRPENVLQLG